MKKIWLKSATAEDFTEAETGDWFEGVGMITTHFEKDFIRRFGERLLRRDHLRIHITQRHEFNDQDGDISNAAWRLHLKQKTRSKYLMDEERKKQRIRNTIIPNTHTGRIAAG